MDNPRTDPLQNRAIVVTGATSGIGLAVAQQLAARGAFVLGVGRSAERCQEARRQVLATSPEAQVDYLLADLSLQSQVRRLAADIREKLAGQGRNGLDGLINNAGLFTYWMTLTAEGFEMQWAVNHLCPFLLTCELLPQLRAAGRARVITVSSGSHRAARLDWNDIQLRRRYNGLRAYGQTKLANILFTLELNRRLGPDSTVRAFAANPGLVNTNIAMKDNPGLVRWIWGWRKKGGITPEESARGLVFLASDPSLDNAADIYWKHGVPQTPSPRALDAESARRLWEISAQMCGIAGELPQ